MKKEINQYLLLGIMLLSGLHEVTAQDGWQSVINLKGDWKFAIGDNQRWADPAYDDRDWEKIIVPARWEDEGFYGYNGHAWYRKTFDGATLKNQQLSFNLFLGYIDDVDEVYLNGHKVGGSGSFPPRYQTAYNAFRRYHIPKEYIDFTGKNVIAVRVYDSEIHGGIISGDVGIFTNRDDEDLAINLRGIWDFKPTGKPGSHAEFDRNFLTALAQSANGAGNSDKKEWRSITVPGVWEHQGYDSYNGSAWYRKNFMLPKELQGEDLVLMLGKIDDYDQTYLNGKLVGSTNNYNKFRIYHVSSDMVKAGSNTLLIYVDDPQGYGGIYDSPVGFIRQSDFTKYFRWRK